ncbi:MAG: hypothetical protein S4CHLAM7_14940 [Chlamydiae bacterium]|nr:hypothetical protein [Chlamydiota bacterium]
MDFWFLALFLLIGLVAGFFSGTLGVGGGVLVVPSLYWVLSWNGSPDALDKAIATSLCVMIFTSTASSITHALKKGIVWKIFFWILMGVFVGSILGPITSTFLSSKSLKFILAFFEILIGLYLLLKNKLSWLHRKHEKPPIETPWFFVPFGIFVSFVASLLGIGGGVFIVTALILLRHSLHKAIATSSLCIVPMSIIASATYFLLAQRTHSTSFTDLISFPSLIALALGSLVAGPIGAIFCYKLSNTTLRVIFATFLMIMGTLFFI